MVFGRERKWNDLNDTTKNLIGYITSVDNILGKKYSEETLGRIYDRLKLYFKFKKFVFRGFEYEPRKEVLNELVEFWKKREKEV